ncbi:MAG TPA: DUF1800 domain-containing protein [Gemmatimonadales bacterium]
MRRLIPAVSALLLLTGPLTAQGTPVDSAVHLLNRAAWGPRPGDGERVAAQGITAWIDAQLAPQRLDDQRAERFVGRYRTLAQSPEALLRVYDESRRANRARQRAGDTARGPDRPPAGIALVTLDLQQATIARAMLSERQLYEVLVDVWTNHFNVFLGKNINRALTTDYIASAIRPNALGRFEDLLLATARHPAMLVYLDNAQSVAAGAVRPRQGRRRAAQPARAPRGINENYARELLELHTLGVDGGYTQDDVIAVARILTGWSLDPGSRARFAYRAWAHDTDAKQVMGQEFRAGGGEDEGVALLRWLADHPSTMRHVSAKLCARFVADEPPDGCIDAGVHAWERSGGNIAAVVRAILLSPEFWAPEHRANKIKTPFEFLVSAARALDAVPDTTFALARQLARLGQPLFLCTPPTGYPERMESWISSSALFDRFNLALGIAAGRMPGLVMQLDRTLDQATVEAGILQGRASPTTRETLASATADLRPGERRVMLVGLALGSPEFQRQ